jgi:hypothetical protein
MRSSPKSNMIPDIVLGLGREFTRHHVERRVNRSGEEKTKDGAVLFNSSVIEL